MIYAWERGDHDLSERYELLYRAPASGPEARHRAGRPRHRRGMHGTLARSRLDTLSAGAA